MEQQSKLARTKEKTQIKWGIELFRQFVTYSAKKGAISSSQSNTLQDELKKLAEEIVGEALPESIAERLNQCIGIINMHMKQSTETIKYFPFPTFSIATEGFLQSAVLDQLDMVERILTEAVDAGILDWDQESSYFADVLQVFSDVESEKILPLKGMERLIGEIEKINRRLPPENALPVPDLNAYELVSK